MKVSHHAIARMNERNIDPQDIIDTIKNGIRTVNKWDDNKYTFKHKHMNLFAVTDKGMKTLITVFRKER